MTDADRIARAKKDGVSAVRRPEPRTFFDDEDFQDHLTALLVSDVKALADCAHLLTADDFKPLRGMKWGRPRWTCAELALEHYSKHHEPIGKLLKASGLEYVDRIQLGDRAKQEIVDYSAYLAKLKVTGPDSIVEKVVRYKQERLRAQALHELVEAQAAGELTDEKWMRITQRVMAGAPELTRPVSAAEIWDASYTEPRWLLNPMLPAASLTMLTARPKSGKTWLALQAAIAVARGAEFLGRRPKLTGRALYLALEDSPRRIHERLHILARGAGPAELAGLEFLHAAGDPASAMPRLLEAGKATKRAYRLVVIDPWLAAAKARKSHDDIVRGEYAELQPLRRAAADYDAAILVVHHTRKAAGDIRDTALGTTGVAAAVDALWSLRADPDGDPDVRLLAVTGRDVIDASMRLAFTPAAGGFCVLDEGPESGAGPREREILEALREAKSGLPPAKLVERLGWDRNLIYQKLHNMRRSGKIIRRMQDGMPRYFHPAAGRGKKP